VGAERPYRTVGGEVFHSRPPYERTKDVASSTTRMGASWSGDHLVYGGDSESIQARNRSTWSSGQRASQGTLPRASRLWISSAFVRTSSYELRSKANDIASRYTGRRVLELTYWPFARIIAVHLGRLRLKSRHSLGSESVRTLRCDEP
jgi:hypothetical protein